MVDRGLYDPKKPLPHVAAGDVFVYRELVDLDYAMPKQRQGAVTLSLPSNGGEVEWLARDILQTNTNETLRFPNEEYLDIRDRYPGEFALMANAHALEEGCREVVDDMLSRNNAKAIAVCSSYNVLADRQFPIARKPSGFGSTRRRKACPCTCTRRIWPSRTKRQINTV